jgi:glycosyltransferase involved in cell wall biosynthesis
LSVEQRDLFIVCNNFEELGGVQTWVHQIGRLFTARGHRVHLVGISHPQRPCHDFGADFPYRTSVLCERHPYLPPHAPNPLRRADPRMLWRERRRLADLDRAARRLSRIFAEAEPGGVVIVAQPWAMEWVARADTCGMPVIGMTHESYAASRGSQRHQRILRYFGDVDRLVLLTDADAERWAADGMSNVTAIPNPLTVAPSRLASPQEQTVVRLGRLHHAKGQDMLLEAWAGVIPAHPGWRLRIHGSGPAEETLRALTAELGIGSSVELPGPTSDITGALLGGSVFAQTSREEGFPMSIMEAMAHGLPCVAFDCAPGIRELITDGVDGLVVPPGNVKEFSAALGELMADTELRAKMGRAAAESVRRFHPDRVVDRWEWLFEMVYR